MKAFYKGNKEGQFRDWKKTNSESVVAARLGRGWAGKSSLQGGHPRDVSSDSGKGAEHVELAPRWLPVGRGRPESAAAARTASRVSRARCGLMLPTSAITWGACFLSAASLWEGGDAYL